jgi:hypothetical protein
MNAGAKRRVPLWPLALGLALCALTVAVPILARRDEPPRPPTAELIAGPDGRWSLRYTSGGYVFVWLVAIGADRKIELLFPERVPAGGGGHPVARDGETVLLPPRASQIDRSAVWWVLFSPVPRKPTDFAAAVAAAPRSDPAQIAAGLRFPGKSWVLQRPDR